LDATVKIIIEVLEAEALTYPPTAAGTHHHGHDIGREDGSASIGRCGAMVETSIGGSRALF